MKGIPPRNSTSRPFTTNYKASMCNVTLSLITSKCVLSIISNAAVSSACRAFRLDFWISTPRRLVVDAWIMLISAPCLGRCTQHLDCSRLSSVVNVWCLLAWRWLCLLLVYTAQALPSWKYESAFPPPLGFSGSSSITNVCLARPMNCLSSNGWNYKYLRNDRGEVCLLVYTMNRFLTP